MIEKELKYIISEKDFFKLKNYLENQKMREDRYDLENIYLDSNDLILLNSGVSLRLRNFKEKKRWVFTYKCSIKGKLYNQRRDGALINEEINKTIDEKKAQSIINGEISVWDFEFDFIEKLKEEIFENKNVKDNKILPVAKINVIRTKYSLNPYKVPLEMDEIDYDNKKEYEIESEFNNLELAESLIMNLRKRVDIRLEPSKEPKIIRTLKRKGFKNKIKYTWL